MTRSPYDYGHYMIVSISIQFINYVTDNDDFVTKFVVTADTTAILKNCMINKACYMSHII